MNSLRQEFDLKNNKHNKLIDEAAFEWIKNNVILINEKIDRKTINRLINSIQKFEDTFGPYREKIPALANHLDQAEESLNLAITGKISNRKISNTLEQLTYLYSTFGNFFTRDLPVLLKTKMFSTAQHNPEIPLETLQNFNPKIVCDALSNALKPSNEEKQLLAKIYRGTVMPKLNTKLVAGQMLSLSYNDLIELTKIGKVPMAVVDTNLSNEDDVNQPTAENIILTNENLLQEQRILAEATMEEVIPKINLLKKIVSTADVLQPLSGPVNDLQSKVLSALADGNVKTYLQQLTKGVGSLADLFKSPKGKILAQANMAIETMVNVSAAWNKIQPLLDKDNVTAQDIANVKKILTSQIKGGTMQRLKALFGRVTPFNGLSPDEILAVLFVPLDEYLQSPEAQTDLLQAKIAQ